MWPLSPSRAVFLGDGVVAPDLPEPRRAGAADGEPVDGVIVPAFADWHFHWVQLGIAGIGAAELLTWLARTTWPAEERFGDPAYATVRAREAVETLRAVGTLAGAAFGSPHPQSAAAFLDVAGPGFLCGPAVMTSLGPDTLVTSCDLAVRATEDLADRYGSRVAVTPRFAVSCDQETLSRHPEVASRRRLALQTHLAESGAEVEEVARLFPDARDYTDVYERAGLLGPRTLLAHVIHVGDDELRRIAASRAVVVHCPTSNLALGSGRMPLERLRAHGVPWVLGSDVGAGPEPCLLDVIAAALTVHEGHARVAATELFHRATLGCDAVLGGRTETAARSVGDRPGALVLPRPRGVSRREADPEVWFRAIVAEWERTGALAPIATADWTA